tara:strand:- start:3196 stop:3330 length:135 start_codon:yes stop_codon:yes gene_type:complete
MNKLIIKVLLSFGILFLAFFIYLGTTNFAVIPKIVEKEFNVKKN